MSYHGDIRLGDTIDIKFTTRQISGAPFTLAGTPVISAYPGNSTTQLTAGITLTVDFDALTGLNNVRVVASGANGYATATNYELVITTGTVNSVSVVGEVIGSFSIEARSALMPTTGGRTLGVSAANKVDGVVLTDTVTTLTNLPAITANWLTAAGIAAAALNGKGDWNIGKTGYALSAAGVQAIWDALTTALTTVGSIGKLLVDNINATISSRLASADITLAAGAVTVGTNNDKTGYALTAGERNSVADAMLDRDMATGTDSGSATVRTMRQALRFLRNKWSISGTTLTVTKENDTTASWTSTVTTTAGADPVTANDPADA